MSARDPMLSPDWYRVQSLRPRVRAGVSVSRQTVRGDVWHVLSDPSSGRNHRFNDVAYRLLASCDGARTVDEIWATRVATDGEDAPTQNDTIQVLRQAFAANLLATDVTPDLAATLKAGDQMRRRRRAAATNPFAFRVPLWDPESVLSRHGAIAVRLFSRSTVRACWAIVFLGALLALVNMGALIQEASTFFASPRALLVLWLAFPIVKALHEAAHAFAVKAHGGEVHEVGLSLLFLTPVPFVDASASAAFAEKSERATVALAGIMIETVLASAALIAWLMLEPGLTREVAFAVVFVGGISTVIVNGNPLLKFDGYYAMCDLLELPNLSMRSAAYWQFLAKRYLLGARHARRLASVRGEVPWLVFYAPVSWLYRAALMGVITLFVAQYSATAGLIVAVLCVFSLVAKPMFRAIEFIADGAELTGRRARAAVVVMATLGTAGVAIFALPLPYVTRAMGIVWLPETAMVRPGIDGFVAQLLVRDGESVQKGAPILELANEPLAVELERVEALITKHQTERLANFGVDALRTALAGDELAHLAVERDQLQQKIEQLTVRSAATGRIALHQPDDLLGKYLTRGQLVAHVLTNEPPLVRVLVRNEDVSLVRAQPGAIDVTPVFDSASTYPARFEREVPQASRTLPTAALGESGGGTVPVDPADQSGRTAREPWFEFDLRLAQELEPHIGARVLVAFRHGDVTAAAQLAALLRRIFLRHFER